MNSHGNVVGDTSLMCMSICFACGQFREAVALLTSCERDQRHPFGRNGRSKVVESTGHWRHNGHFHGTPSLIHNLRDESPYIAILKPLYLDRTSVFGILGHVHGMFRNKSLLDHVDVVDRSSWGGAICRLGLRRRRSIVAAKIVLHLCVELLLRLLGTRVITSAPASALLIFSATLSSALSSALSPAVTPALSSALSSGTWATSSTAPGHRAPLAAALAWDVPVDSLAGCIVLIVPTTRRQGASSATRGRNALRQRPTGHDGRVERVPRWTTRHQSQANRLS